MIVILVKLVEYWKLALFIMMWLLRNSSEGRWGGREVKQNLCGVFFNAAFGLLFLAGVRIQLGKIRSGREMDCVIQG